MRSTDFAPLFRSTVGFDRFAQLFDAAANAGDVAYPPYNIEKTDEHGYRVTMAVAGFSADEVDVTWKPQELTVSAKRAAKDDAASYLHRGIAARDFQRSFSLADHIEVRSATLENGLLAIDLVRNVPEALKPRRIAIATAAPEAIEARAA
ncbi:MAG: Hsp20 family protein [Pseudomonadota bacterium]